MEVGLPAWLDGMRCCWHSVVLSALSPWTASIDLSGMKFWVGNFWLRLKLGIIDSVRCCRLLCSFVDVICRFLLLSFILQEFLSGWRCINCGHDCFPFGSIFLRSAIRLCSTFLLAPYRPLYSWFPFRSWRFLLVSVMFWTIRVHFRLLPTDTKVQPLLFLSSSSRSE
jgi:hypothetical protein